MRTADSLYHQDGRQPRCSVLRQRKRTDVYIGRRRRTPLPSLPRGDGAHPLLPSSERMELNKAAAAARRAVSVVVGRGGTRSGIERKKVENMRESSSSCSGRAGGRTVSRNTYLSSDRRRPAPTATAAAAARDWTPDDRLDDASSSRSSYAAHSTATSSALRP